MTKAIVELAPDNIDFNRICQKQTLFVELLENKFEVSIMASLKYL